MFNMLYYSNPSLKDTRYITQNSHRVALPIKIYNSLILNYRLYWSQNILLNYGFRPTLEKYNK